MIRSFIVSSLLLAGAACAGTISYTGTLANSTDTVTESVTLTSAGAVVVQTYGFGGGVNAAGTTITPGGFDPFIGVFDSLGNLIQGTSDSLSNYASPVNYAGCPMAGTVNIGLYLNQCGDVRLLVGLAAGTYSILLSDANYQPNALFDSPNYGNLSEGFTDFTGGVFQTCADVSNCISPSANWAMDVTTTGAQATAPEPAEVGLVGTGLLSLILARCRKQEK